MLLEQAARHGVELSLTVPTALPFPTREQWEEAGCEARYADSGKLSVVARPWHPPVGPGESEESAAEDIRRVYRGEQNPSPACPADPFWTAALGEKYQTYKSIGQRQAARTVVAAPPGSTTIVCLPTGQGKTEVATGDRRSSPAACGASPCSSCRPWCSRSTMERRIQKSAG